MAGLSERRFGVSRITFAFPLLVLFVIGTLSLEGVGCGVGLVEVGLGGVLNALMTGLCFLIDGVSCLLALGEVILRPIAGEVRAVDFVVVVRGGVTVVVTVRDFVDA